MFRVPSYYSFDHGPTHFLVLDDVTWVAAHDGEDAHYHGGLGKDQLTFIRNDYSLEFRAGDGPWTDMQAIRVTDPAFVAAKAAEESLPDNTWRNLPGAHPTPHMYRAMLPTPLPLGTHTIQIKATTKDDDPMIDHRIIRVEP